MCPRRRGSRSRAPDSARPRRIGGCRPRYTWGARRNHCPVLIARTTTTSKRPSSATASGATCIPPPKERSVGDGHHIEGAFDDALAVHPHFSLARCPGPQRPHDPPGERGLPKTRLHRRVDTTDDRGGETGARDVHKEALALSPRGFGEAHAPGVERPTRSRRDAIHGGSKIGDAETPREIATGSQGQQADRDTRAGIFRQHTRGDLARTPIPARHEDACEPGGGGLAGQSPRVVRRARRHDFGAGEAISNELFDHPTGARTAAAATLGIDDHEGVRRQRGPIIREARANFAPRFQTGYRPPR